MTSAENKVYKTLENCWNCNSVQLLTIKYGVSKQEYLQKTQLNCRNCGCTLNKKHNSRTDQQPQYNKKYEQVLFDQTRRK